MTSDPIEVQGAKWLIYYFKKGWSMYGLRRQLEALDADIGKFPFMPADAWWYTTKEALFAVSWRRTIQS